MKFLYILFYLAQQVNLYDIFYGRFRKNETEILKSYIEEAPRDTFKDILDAIDRFVYFENRKK